MSLFSESCTATVPRTFRDRIFTSRKFSVTQLLYYGCHHTWRMPEIQDCNVTFCESFARVPRELCKSWVWDLKRGALSFSQLPHFHTYSLSLSRALLLSLSQSFTSLCHSPSVSLFLTPSLSLSLTISLLLSVCLYVSRALSLSLSLSLSVSLSLHVSLAK